MNSKTLNSKVNALLAKIAEKVWKEDDYSGDVLIPKIADIQEMAVATPENLPVTVESNGKAYRLIVSTEGDVESLRKTKQLFPHTETEIETVMSSIEAGMVQTDESFRLLFVTEGQDLAKCLDIISRFIMRTAGEPSLEQVLWLQGIWGEKEKNIEHPLMSVVRAWIKTQGAIRITSEQDRKYPVAVLKHPLGTVKTIAFTDREAGTVFQTPERVEQLQMELDIGTPPSVLPAIMPLQVVQTADLKPQTKSGAVSHELRIFFEAMMALQPNQRKADLMFRLGDLIDFLYPNGKFNWTNQMPHIKRALAILHNSATIPWIDDQGSLRRWRPVSVRAPLEANATRDTPVFMDVVMPPDAKSGHMIIKQIHRLVGMKSAAQWNAYHVACFLWDKYGTVKGKLVDPTRPVDRRDTENRLVDATRKPLVNRNGKPIKSPYHKEAIHQLDREPNPDALKRYPILSNEDLILACYPNRYQKRDRSQYLKRAKAHWQALHEAGYVVIHKERAGWRILPPTEHLNAHRALRKSSEGVY